MKVRCQMQTKSGMYAQYDGYVDVRCHDLAEWNEVFQAPVKALQRTAYPGYNASMWKLISYERID